MHTKLGILFIPNCNFPLPTGAENLSRPHWSRVVSLSKKRLAGSASILYVPHLRTEDFGHFHQYNTCVCLMHKTYRKLKCRLAHWTAVLLVAHLINQTIEEPLHYSLAVPTIQKRHTNPKLDWWSSKEETLDSWSIPLSTHNRFKINQNQSKQFTISCSG